MEGLLNKSENFNHNKMENVPCIKVIGLRFSLSATPLLRFAQVVWILGMGVKAEDATTVWVQNKLPRTNYCIQSSWATTRLMDKETSEFQVYRGWYFKASHIDGL